MSKNLVISSKCPSNFSSKDKCSLKPDIFKSIVLLNSWSLLSNSFWELFINEKFISLSLSKKLVILLGKTILSKSHILLLYFSFFFSSFFSLFEFINFILFIPLLLLLKLFKLLFISELCLFIKLLLSLLLLKSIFVLMLSFKLKSFIKLLLSILLFSVSFIFSILIVDINNSSLFTLLSISSSNKILSFIDFFFSSWKFSFFKSLSDNITFSIFISFILLSTLISLIFS